jgi:hypothetical protein
MPRPTHPLNSHLPRRCWLPFPSPHPPTSQAASSGLVLGVSSRSSSSGYKLFFKSIWAVHPQVPASCCSQTQFKLPSPETPSSHRARAILKYSPLEPQAPVANRSVFKLWSASLFVSSAHLRSQVLSLLVRASDVSRFCIGKGSNLAFVPTPTGRCLRPGLHPGIPLVRDLWESSSRSRRPACSSAVARYPLSRVWYVRRGAIQCSYVIYLNIYISPLIMSEPKNRKGKGKRRAAE